MKIITQQTTLDELERMAAGMFGTMVKAVVESAQTREKIMLVVAKRIRA